MSQDLLSLALDWSTGMTKIQSARRNVPDKSGPANTVARGQKVSKRFNPDIVRNHFFPQSIGMSQLVHMQTFTLVTTF